MALNGPALTLRLDMPRRTVTVGHNQRATMTAADSTPKSEVQPMIQSKLEQEVYSLMRATGRSRVQVLNAIKVRGPAREDVLRALAR